MTRQKNNAPSKSVLVKDAGSDGTMKNAMQVNKDSSINLWCFNFKKFTVAKGLSSLNLKRLSSI